MDTNNEITPLVRIATEDTAPDNRLKAIDCLARLPLARSDLVAVAKAALKLLADLEAAARTDADAVRILARVPSRSVREALGRIAGQSGHKVRLACALALAEFHDAGGIEALLAEFRRTHSLDILQAIACLPLEALRLPQQAFDEALQDADPIIRFWAAVASARLGYYAPIEELWEVLSAEPGATFEGHRHFVETPPLFYGDPWTPYDALARGRPVPAELHELLVRLRDATLQRQRGEHEWQSPGLTRDANLLFGGLTGLTDVYGEPILADSRSEPVPVPEPEPATPPNPAAEALAQDLLKHPIEAAKELTEEQRALLHALSGTTAGRLLWAYLGELSQRIKPATDPRRLFDENELQAFAWALPDIDLEPLQLISDTQLVKKLSRRIVSWTLMRVGSRRVLASLAPHALAVHGAARSNTLSWIQSTLSAESIGGGAGGGTAEAVVEVIDDSALLQPKMHSRHHHRPIVISDTPKPGLGTRVAALADKDIPHFDAFPEELAGSAPDEAAAATGSADTPPKATRLAWPHLSCADSVVVGEPFDLEVGIGPQRDQRLTGTGGLVLPVEDFDLHIELLPDPGAFFVDGERVFTLRVTQADPYPRRTVKVVALGGPGLSGQRRMGVAYSAGGVLRGYAQRQVDVRPMGSAPQPQSPAPERNTRRPADIDLTPFVAADEADLTIVIRRGDDDAGRTLVFTACSPVVDLAESPLPPTIDLGNKPDEFAAEIVRKASAESQSLKLFDLLVGNGKSIAGKLPADIREALRKVCGKAATEQRAASVLIVSEEPYVPWELAVIEPALPSPGCDSPFLGAQVALGRWILSGDRPPPHPNRSLAVSEQAVVVGKYEGVLGWKRLKNAETEAEDLEKAWPSTRQVPAAYAEVRDYLHGKKTAEALHFALHGKFDASGLQSGLILIKQRTGQPDILEPDVLEAKHVRGGDLSKSAAFVFLNACQIGAAQQLLGDYAGMAEAFLFIGATAVIAPLWSIDDGEARKIALSFYHSAYDDHVSPAEILRRVRARFTESEALSTAGISPTHLAYQFFGHPKLTMTRTDKPHRGDDR